MTKDWKLVLKLVDSAYISIGTPYEDLHDNAHDYNFRFTLDFNAPSVSNGNRTDWSPIRSVIIRVITKSDDRAAGVRFVYHEYDYRPNWTTHSEINYVHDIIQYFEKHCLSLPDYCK